VVHEVEQYERAADRTVGDDAVRHDLDDALLSEQSMAFATSMQVRPFALRRARSSVDTRRWRIEVFMIGTVPACHRGK
jgi:hypothetical protein